MTRTRATPDGWHSIAELADRFGRTQDEMEALGRRHHWPRVNQEHGILYGVNIEVVAEALGATAQTTHGSLGAREERDKQY